MTKSPELKDAASRAFRAHQDPSSSARFAVVGIGAAAGGIEPTRALLRRLGSCPRLALVVVHHSDPTRVRGLVDLLADATPMSVRQARHGERVQANCVYVSPEQADLSIAQGAFVLQPRATDDVELTIDRFLVALALDTGPCAASVILSGGTTDGSRGSALLRRAGGFTFAQDASATCRRMPDSAIANGSVDRVLPPERIAEELQHLSQRLALADQHGTERNSDLQGILTSLERSAGFDVRAYAPTRVLSVVRRRMVLRRSQDLSEYRELIDSQLAEARALADELSLRPLGFFRDSEAMDTLASSVYTALLERAAATEQLRIWVPACGTGEEVYSLAISLLDSLPSCGTTNLKLRLIGTDVGERAIAEARAGEYPDGIALELSPDRLRRYFTKTADGYRIRPEVRELCLFAEHDFTRDPELVGIDMVSCRDLTSALEDASRHRLLTQVHEALRPRGYLLVGKSDRIEALPGFVALDSERTLWLRTAAAVEGRSHRLPPTRATPEEASTRDQDLEQEFERVILNETARTGVIVTDALVVVRYRGRTGEFLEPASGAASHRLMPMVRAELRVPLRLAMDEARRTGRRARATGRMGDHARTVEMSVLPFESAATKRRHYGVVFDDTTVDAEPGTVTRHAADARTEITEGPECARTLLEQLDALEERLHVTAAQLASCREELAGAESKLLLARKQGESVSLELRAARAQWVASGRDTRSVHRDLEAVLKQVELPVVFVGRDLCVRRFTHAAEKLFDLRESDLGRSIAELGVIRAFPMLPTSTAEVVDTLAPLQCSAQDEHGRWHQLTLRADVTADGRVEGVVITALDLEAYRRSANRARELQRYVDAILAAVRHGLVVVDADLRVHAANQAFCELFRLSEKTTKGRVFGELAPELWGDPSVQAKLSALRSNESFDGLLSTHEVPQLGTRELLLGARRIKETSYWLLALEDVTERERDRRAVVRTERRLQRATFEAAVAEERERRRIALGLHDRVSQALALGLNRLTSLQEPLVQTAREAIDDAVDMLSQSITDIRTLTFELSPPVLYDLGLKAALSWLVEDVEKRCGIRVELRDDAADKPLDEVSAALVYRAVRELLLNVSKHAGTPSATLTLRRTDDWMQIDVEDRGLGFSPEDLLRRSTGGFGLFSVRDQVDRLGGAIEISSAPGEGTRVNLKIPLKPIDVDAAELGGTEVEV